LYVFLVFAARLWKRILCVNSVLLKRIDSRGMLRIRFQSRAAKNKNNKNYKKFMQNKTNKMNIAQKSLKISQNPSNFWPKGASLSLFP